MARYTYDDYKQRISIMQVALELGYRLDKSKGKSQLSFVRYDDHGRETDRIYVKNWQDNAKSGYWRRHVTQGYNTGDLISFVRENIREFNEFVTARNEVDAINKVLARMANVSIDNDEVMTRFKDSLKERTVRPFSLDRYERDPGNISKAMSLLRPRGITEETAALFRDSFEMIRDTGSQYNFLNLAFPFRRPGMDDIVGYEVRGFRGFKSKSEGTDSTHGCWMAYLGESQPCERPITELHFAESALDIMAFVQLNRQNLNLEQCLFISFGGSFSVHQMEGVLKEYPEAMPILHFDNDINGVMYDIETACIIEGKELKHRKDGENLVFDVGDRNFSIPIEKLGYYRFCQKANVHPRLQLSKALGGFKDWNDITIAMQQNAPINEENNKATINEKIDDIRHGYHR